jgi:hypothetical protein
MRSPAFCLLLAAAAGCAAKKTEGAATQPAPVTATTRFTGVADMDLEGANAPDNVPDDVFAGIGIAAAGWAKGTATSGSVGVVFPDGAPEKFKRALEAISQKYAWRPMRQNEVGMSCVAGGSRSLAGATCSMKMVASVFRLNRVLVRGDSSWTTLSIIKVPSGSREMQTTFYCVELGYQGTGWVARHGEKVVSARLCPRPAGMP